MVETSLDRQDGDLFWKKRNLLTLAVEVNWVSNKAERLKKRGNSSGGKAITMIPPKRPARSSAPDEIKGKALIEELEKETGPIAPDMIMSELPGFKMPEPFTLPISETRLHRFTDCLLAYQWLVGFVETHKNFFESQTLCSLFFNNEGLSEFRERVVVLRESIYSLLAEHELDYLTDSEYSELLSIWIKGEVFARVSGNVLDFIAWAANETKSVVASNAAEDFREFSSVRIYRTVSDQLTPLFKRLVERTRQRSVTHDTGDTSVSEDETKDQ